MLKQREKHPQRHRSGRIYLSDTRRESSSEAKSCTSEKNLETEAAERCHQLLERALRQRFCDDFRSTGVGQHRRNTRRSKKRDNIEQISRESDSDSGSATDTSNKESMGQQRLRQAKLVRRIDSLMHRLIARDREKNNSLKQWEALEGEFKHRLDYVEAAD